MKGKQGFASMDKEAAQKARSKGGRRSWETGKAHRWTPETATLARKKRI